MIRVFVGTAPKWESHEPILEHSIRSNTDADVEVTFMRAWDRGLKPSGCTGFTNYRYAVPELAGHEGFAIYLDIDMVVLGDIAELWEYRSPGIWACMKDGATEVMVIDCTPCGLPYIEDIDTFKKHQLKSMVRLYPCIPPEWNVQDRVEPGMKLLHFTDLRQNWIAGDHSCREALEILHEYRKESVSLSDLRAGSFGHIKKTAGA